MNSYYPPWIGGAESYVRSLAQALAQRENEVTVYCSERPLKAGESSDHGIRIVRMRTPITFYGTPIVMFPASIFSEKFDVIHANFPSPYLAGISAYVSALKGTGSVLTWHNDLPPVTSGAGLVVKLHDAVSPAYLNTFDRIIATTKIYAKKSTTLRRYSEKVRIIHNGVDAERFHPNVSGDSIRSNHRLEGRKVVLFVGALTRWHSYKGVDVLLPAFKIVSNRLPDARLLIVGGGEMIGAYENLVRDLDLQERVIFAGRVSDEILPHYYAACDCAVLPSKDSSEGYGLVLLEAMATGKAVIGSMVGGITDVIDQGKNGLLVAPNNIEELSGAILNLLDDYQLRTRMGTSGRSIAEERDWRKVAAQVESLYKEIL